MGGHQHRGAGISEFEQRFPEIAPRLRIDRTGRLIQEQQFRRMDHRTGQRQPLLLPAAEGAGQLHLAVLQTVLLQQRIHAPPRLHPWQILDGSQEFQVLPHRQVFVQRKALGHVADAAAQRFGLRRNGQAQHFDLARAWFKQPAQHADGGRLARPVRAEEAVYLPARHLQVDVVHRQQIAEAAAQALRAHGDVIDGIQKRTCTGSPAGSACMSALSSISISAR
ncbi:hypothetical protein D3C72_1579130 [compost metagenome]